MDERFKGLLGKLSAMLGAKNEDEEMLKQGFRKNSDPDSEYQWLTTEKGDNNPRDIYMDSMRSSYKSYKNDDVIDNYRSFSSETDINNPSDKKHHFIDSQNNNTQDYFIDEERGLINKSFTNGLGETQYEDIFKSKNSEYFNAIFKQLLAAQDRERKWKPKL